MAAAMGVQVMRQRSPRAPILAAAMGVRGTRQWSREDSGDRQEAFSLVGSGSGRSATAAGGLLVSLVGGGGSEKKQSWRRP